MYAQRWINDQPGQMMALTPKRLFLSLSLSLCISISLLRPYTFFSRSPLLFKTLFENACELQTYRVGSVNFSWRKQGHAHDNSADSENVAGAREPSVHAHFIFRFENGQGNQSFFLPITKIQLKRVNYKFSRRTVDAPSTGRFREASSGPEKLKFGSARLSRKRQTSWIVESFF